MKIPLIFVLTWITLNSCLYSQKFKLPIEYRFKNGEYGYFSFFSKNISFPETDLAKGIIGNSITKVSISPKGEITGITVINPIDSTIDNEVLRAINLSTDLWKKCDTVDHDQVFYIQIAFSLPNFQPNVCIPETYDILRFFPKPVLIAPLEPLSGSKPNEAESRYHYIKTEELSEKANSCVEKGMFDEALPLINELIKRDPFNRDLYKVRIMINIRLNRPDLVDQDDNKISDFAEGFSIDDLNKDQD